MVANMADDGSPSVLILGKLHPHAVERIEESFNAIRAAGNEAKALTWADRNSVRAIATFSRTDAELIDSFPNLEIISSFGAGYDHVDVQHAARNGIIVTNTPDCLSDEVADTTIGLLINTVRELPRAEAWLREGKWPKEQNYPLTPLTLRDRTVGIAGMGRIGKAIARRLEAFGLPVAYHSRSRKEDLDYEYFDELHALASACDTLVSVLPLSETTLSVIDARTFENLGPQGVFISIGRGETVDENALIAALKNKTIAAAGLDVYWNEPEIATELLALDNVCLLPHVGSASVHTRRAMADCLVDNLSAWFATGKPLNPVSVQDA